MGAWLILASLTAWAQSISITTPAAAENVSLNAGPSGTAYQLTCSISSITNLYSIGWSFDGEPASPIAYSTSPTVCPATTWNPYFLSNGTHTASLVAYDAKGNVLATSSSHTFSVENNLPQQTCGTTCTDVTATFANAASTQCSAGCVLAVTSYKCTGTCAICSGSPQFSSYSTSPQSATLSNTVTTDGVLGFAMIASPTATLSSVTVGGVSATLGTPTHCTSSANCTVQPFYLLNITGATSTVVTATSTAGNVEVWAWDVQNVATSAALDVFTSATSSTTPMTFTLAQASEIVLFGGTTFAGGSATQTWPGTNGWTITKDSPQYSSIAQTIIPPSTGWWGSEAITLTVNGPNSGISGKEFDFYVDGELFASNQLSLTSASSYTAYLDTSLYLNVAHQVRAHTTGCSGCASNGHWTDMGAWEATETFNNITPLPMQLIASARESFLCLIAGTNCPTSATISASWLNNDGSTTAATITGCTYNPSGGQATLSGANTSTPVVTTSISGGNCTLTENSVVGFDFVTISASINNQTFTRKIWAGVADSSKWSGSLAWTIPNFATDRTIQQGWNAAHPGLWQASIFQGGSEFQPLTYSTSLPLPVTIAGPAYAQAGFNTAEFSSPTPTSCSASTTSPWETCVNAKFNVTKTNLTTYGQGKMKYIRLLNESFFNNSLAFTNLTVGPWSTFAGPCYGTAVTPCPAFEDYLYMAAASGIVMNQNMADEAPWGPLLLAGTNTSGIIIGTNGFTQITGNGSTCTITWSPSSLNAGGHFIITGSGQSTLDYNTSTNTPQPFGTAYSSFPCSFNSTLTSGSAQIEPLANVTYDSSMTACPPNGSSAGPCTKYLHYDAIKQVSTWNTSASGPFITWSAANGGSGPLQACGNGGPICVIGGIKAGVYAEAYYTPGTSIGSTSAYDYSPTEPAIYDVIGSIGDSIRARLNWMDQTTPLIQESEGLINNYSFHQGPGQAVASCSGNTITFSSPHGLANVPQPDYSQVSVTGSSGGNCDGNYFVITSPTATTLTVMLAKSPSSINAASATLTFPDSSTISTSTSAGSCATSSSLCNNSSDNSGGQFKSNSPLRSHRGQIFTISGSGTALDSTQGYYDWLTLDSTSAFSFWRQIPNITSSTGGTATILPSMNYVRGIQWSGNTDNGPKIGFLSDIETALAGGSGHRAYTYNSVIQSYDRTATGINSCNLFCGNTNLFFNPTDPTNYGAGGLQAGLNMLSDYMNGMVSRMTIAHAQANIILSAFAPFLYGQRLASPDYGLFYEATARTSSLGNLLMIESASMSSKSCTANLTPYLITGQSIDRYYVTALGTITLTILSPGTTSDTMTCEPGSARLYIFPQSGKYTPAQPKIGARLADIPSATDIVIQYSYTPLSFSPFVLAAAQPVTFDCGASCTLPVDVNLGHVYYRLIYLNSSGAVLATSDIEQL